MYKYELYFVKDRFINGQFKVIMTHLKTSIGFSATILIALQSPKFNKWLITVMCLEVEQINHYVR